MSILVTKSTRVIRQGFTGSQVRFNPEPAPAFATKTAGASTIVVAVKSMITRCAIALFLAASPLAAQDADPKNQLVEGYMACMSSGGDVDMTDSMLDALFWTREDDGDAGLITFYPGAGESTFVYMADDGSFCHVESLVVDSATASEILAASLGGEDGAPFDYSKDEMGCTRLDFSTGVMATITSGGNDPNCGSDTDSGVRFTY